MSPTLCFGLLVLLITSSTHSCILIKSSLAPCCYFKRMVRGSRLVHGVVSLQKIHDVFVVDSFIVHLLVKNCWAILEKRDLKLPH